MIKTIYVASSLFLFACTNADISANLRGVQQAYVLSSTALKNDLSSRAAQEHAAAVDRRFEERLPVFQLTGQCNPAAYTLGAPIGSCNLVEIGDVESGPINASQVIAAMDAIGVYLEAITLLATVSSGSDISTQTTALLSSINALASTENPEALAQISTENIAFVAETAGFLTEQMRLAQLRKAVRRADPVIAEIASSISAFLDIEEGSTLEKVALLNAARSKMNAARKSGSESDYREAAALYRVAFDNFYSNETGSSQNLIFLLRAAHADLLARLNNPTTTEITDAINRLQVIQNLAEKAKG